MNAQVGDEILGQPPGQGPTPDLGAGADRPGWTRSGSTVLGRASEIIDADERARIAALPLESWMGNGRDHFVRIQAERVTGRRLQAPQADPRNSDRSQRTVR